MRDELWLGVVVAFVVRVVYVGVLSWGKLVAVEVRFVSKLGVWGWVREQLVEYCEADVAMKGIGNYGMRNIV